MPSTVHLIAASLVLLATACTDPQIPTEPDVTAHAEFATSDASTGIETLETQDAVAALDTETADVDAGDGEGAPDVAATPDLPAQVDTTDTTDADIPNSLDTSLQDAGGDTDAQAGDGDVGLDWESESDSSDDTEATDAGDGSCQGLTDGCWEVSTVTLPADHFLGEWLGVGLDGTIKVAGRQVNFGERELVLQPGQTEWTQGGWPVPLGSGTVESFGYHSVPPGGEPHLLVRDATAPTWHYQYKLDGELLCSLWTQHLNVFAPSIAFDDSGAMVVAGDVNMSPGSVQVCAATPGVGMELFEVFADSKFGDERVHLRLTADGAPEVLRTQPDGLVRYREGLDSWVSEDVYTSGYGSTLPQMVAKNDGAVTHVALALGELFLAAEPYHQVVYVRVTDDGAESVLLVDAGADTLTEENYNAKVLDLAVHPDGSVWVMVATNPDPWSGYTVDVTMYRVGLDGEVGSWPLMTFKMLGSPGRVGAMAFTPDGRLLHLVPDTVNNRTRLRTWTPLAP